MRLRSLLCAMSLASACGLNPLAAAAESPFQIATFSADVTVPLGHALMGGGIAAASEVIDPLEIRGVILIGGEKPVVLASIDWCEIRNDTYDAWRSAIAEAVGTTRDRILLASIHQHDTPVADFAAQRMLDTNGLEKSLCDIAFVEDCIKRTAVAAKSALAEAKPFTHIGLGQAEVHQVASNRRVQFPYQTASFPRNSATRDEAVRAAPVGTIDPNLKMISFWDGDQPLAALSYYAVHPMSFYGKGGVNVDFVGLARRAMQAEHPEVFSVYTSGCSGDVTAGKFNDGSPENRPVLAGKIHDAMKRAWVATERTPIKQIGFRCVPLEIEPRSTKGYSVEELTAVLADANQKTFQRNLAAMGLSWKQRADAGQPIDMPVVDFGKALIIQMPAESFVQYQLDAQSMRPDAFVAVAGYGECAPGYIPSASATEESFIETHDWCWVNRGVHESMLAAMREALGAGGN